MLAHIFLWVLIIIHVWNINIEGPIFVFFQNFTRNRPNFKIPRSSSMRTPSPPGGSSGMLSPGQTKPLGVSSTPGSFQVSTKCSAVQCSAQKRGGIYQLSVRWKHSNCYSIFCCCLWHNITSMIHLFKFWRQHSDASVGEGMLNHIIEKRELTMTLVMDCSLFWNSCACAWR